MEVVREGKTWPPITEGVTGELRIDQLWKGVTPGVYGGVAIAESGEGVVTTWHSHTQGQMMYVVSGMYRVGNEARSEENLTPGAFVYFEPEEKHWHGAAPGERSLIVAVTWGPVTFYHEGMPQIPNL